MQEDTSGLREPIELTDWSIEYSEKLEFWHAGTMMSQTLRKRTSRNIHVCWRPFSSRLQLDSKASCHGLLVVAAAPGVSIHEWRETSDGAWPT